MTVGQVLERALGAYATLASVAEPIEDEAQYLADLTTVWRARLAAVATARSSEPVSPEVVAAIDGLQTEAALVGDPHRAFDWLSTYPQVVLLALGEAP